MIRILAPAKVNLGLEVLGKRADGYHEVRTILCAVSIFDTLQVQSDGQRGLHVDDPALEVNNLVERALRRVEEHNPDLAWPEVWLHKRIPAAAGLGGASSDAAATLLAIQILYPHSMDDCTLHGLASKLGSDVPFFLGSGLALASGRGESLQQLPYQRVDIVIVHPPLSIAGKTATMYGLLDRSDWTDGSAVQALAERLQRNGQFPFDTPLPTAFRRPLYAYHPHLANLAAQVAGLTGLPVHLSGAGPAHFVVCHDVEHRQWIRNRLREAFAPAAIRVLAGRSLASVLMQAS
jgi:4-diphosphocytidyl-2-C-methyl-D-erythritol kinase